MFFNMGFTIPFGAFGLLYPPLLCADLCLVGLGDEAAVVRPELLEGEGLEG